MKKLLMVLLLSPSITMAAGPILKHVQPAQREFENVYQELRSVVPSSTTLPAGSTFYIQNVNDTGALQPNSTVYTGSGTINNFTGQGHSKLYGGAGVAEVVDIIAVNNGPWLIRLINNSANTTHQSYIENSGTFYWYANNTAVYNIDSSGNVTLSHEVLQPGQPSFLVTDGTGATDVTGDTTVYTELWPTEIFDQGSDFASNTFTAPVTGRYFLAASIRITGVLAAHTEKALKIVTSNRNYTHDDVFSIAGSATLMVSCVADMDAGDTATVTLDVSGSTKVVDISASGTFNHFSGSLIN